VRTIAEICKRKIKTVDITRTRRIDKAEAIRTPKAYDEERAQRWWRISSIRKALSLKPEATRVIELPGNAVTRGASKPGRTKAEQSAAMVSTINHCATWGGDG
jgi:hypothetical protein